MTNTSATGGYLVPDGVQAGPLEDDALDDFLHDVVAGISGLANEAVWPRWQPEPPALPTGDWAAFGIAARRTDAFAVVQHDGAANGGLGEDILIRHEELDLVCTCYGPNAQARCSQLRDGLLIGQNREALAAAGFAVKTVGDLTRAPELVKNAWLQRTDLTVTLRREFRRSYPVLNLARVTAILNAPPVTDTVTETLS